MNRIQRSGQPGQVDYRLTAYPSRIRLMLLVLGAFGFVLLGAFLAYNRSQGGRGSIIVGVIAIMFFGFCGIYGVIRLVAPKPALVLDDTGLYDNASALGAGFIGWDSIHDVVLVDFQKQPMISIVVTDPEAVLSHVSGLKRKAMRANIRLLGTPVNIPKTMVPLSLEQLEAEIRQNLDIRRSHR